MSNVVTKGTAKVFKYNAGIESIVDGGTVQLPFISEYKGDRRTAMEYIWFTKDASGNLCKRGIYVSGHGQYGVPTLYDSDVYMALQDIFLRKKTVNGICELEFNSLSVDYLNIEFSMNELAREMGYILPIGKSTRELLKKSIKTLLATTMFSLYEGGIYDIRHKQYVTKKEVGYHLLEEYGNEVTTEDEEVIVDIMHIRLSKFTYLQIVNDYKLFYNKNKYRKPKNRIARKIYIMALQWKGNKDFAYAKIDTLIEKIPMIEEDKRYKKRYIKKALKALNDSGIIKANCDKNDLVYFDFREQKQIDEYKNKYNKYSDITTKLYDMGFNMLEVDELVDVERIRFIQALLRYLDFQKPLKPKRYFLKCYNENIEIDRGFYSENSLVL